MKLPFNWMPGSWGLKGNIYKIAKAEYELTGYELEYELLAIRKEEMDYKEWTKACFDLEFKYNRLTRIEYDKALCELIEDENKKALALLDIDKRLGKVTDLEYSKRLATVNKEPWVTVLNMTVGQKNSLEGSFELDWNEFFVEKLKAEGYQGASPDAIVNQWFMELCRNVAMEEFDGTGDFSVDSAANLETLKRWNSTSESFGDGRKGYK